MNETCPHCGSGRIMATFILPDIRGDIRWRCVCLACQRMDPLRESPQAAILAFCLEPPSGREYLDKSENGKDICRSCPPGKNVA